MVPFRLPVKKTYIETILAQKKRYPMKAMLIPWMYRSHTLTEIVKDLMVEVIEYRFGLIHTMPHRIEWLFLSWPSAYMSPAILVFADPVRITLCTIPCYSPESHGIAESFVKTFKKD